MNGVQNTLAARGDADTLMKARRRLAAMDLRDELDDLARASTDLRCEECDCPNTAEPVARIRRLLADLGVEVPA